MSNYPDRHHPCYFLADALTALGATAEVVRSADTLNCWGLRVNGKLMVWLIDNRHAHEAQHEDPAAKELLERGVLVCHAQKPDMERVGGQWLPLAVTPEYVERPIIGWGRQILFDAAFVGYVRDTGRMQALAHLAAKASLSVAQGVFGLEAVQTYRSARCGVNVPTRYGEPNAYDINMRVFEIAATGIPLVTNHLTELQALGFIDGYTCMTYRDPDDLVQKVVSLRDDWSMAVQIGQRGREWVLKEHTYEVRAKQVLAWLA